MVSTTGALSPGFDWKSHVSPVGSCVTAEIRSLTTGNIVILDIATNLGRPAKVIWFELISSGPVVGVAFNTSSPMTPYTDVTYPEVTWTELKRIDSSLFLVAPINAAGDYLAIEKLYVTCISGGSVDIDVMFW